MVSESVAISTITESAVSETVVAESMSVTIATVEVGGGERGEDDDQREDQEQLRVHFDSCLCSLLYVVTQGCLRIIVMSNHEHRLAFYIDCSSGNCEHVARTDTYTYSDART